MEEKFSSFMQGASGARKYRLFGAEVDEYRLSAVEAFLAHRRVSC
jgi:hypothetical protein